MNRAVEAEVLASNPQYKGCVIRYIYMILGFRKFSLTDVS